MTSKPPAPVPSAGSVAGPRTVTVKLLGREYTVNCPPEEHASLVASAAYVNDRMLAIRRRGKTLGSERIAVMTALNLARELLSLRGDDIVAPPKQEAIDRLQKIGAELDSALDQQE